MKRIIAVFLALVMVVPLVAQDGDTKDERYNGQFSGIVEMGYTYGSYQREISHQMKLAKLRAIFTYQYTPSISFGIGTGIYLKHDRNLLFDGEEPIIPFFLDFRVFRKKPRFSPYASLDIGYSLIGEDFGSVNFSGLGLYINPNAGISYFINEKLAMNNALGYDLQRMRYSGWGYDYSVNSHGVSIIIGITF